MAIEKASEKAWFGNVSRDVLLRVHVVHAQWRVDEPNLRLRDTVDRLLEFGLVQPDRVLEFAKQPWIAGEV